jgi:hypothetical protein
VIPNSPKIDPYCIRKVGLFGENRRPIERATQRLSDSNDRSLSSQEKRTHKDKRGYTGLGLIARQPLAEWVSGTNHEYIVATVARVPR